MKTQLQAHAPEIKVFFKLFAFHLVTMLLLVAVMYLIFNFGAPVLDYLKSVGFILFLFPVMNSIIGAYSLRNHTFTISDVADPAQVADWAAELLQKNEMYIVAEQQNQIILEPKGGFVGWFGKRFGTGLATINYIENEVTIVGPFKYADIVDSKIKFAM